MQRIGRVTDAGIQKRKTPCFAIIRSAPVNGIACRIGISCPLTKYPPAFIAAGCGRRAARPAVFFCYSLPGHAERKWSLDADEIRWYWLENAESDILEREPDIAGLIRCDPDEPRVFGRIGLDVVQACRKKVETRIKTDYFRQLQASARAKAVLLAWMEVVG